MANHIISKEFKIRPRFVMYSHATVDDICSRYKVILKTKGTPFTGKVRQGYISIFPNEDHHHYWSPHLSVIVEQDEENSDQTILRGLYGPSPAVWTMFVFIYAIFVLAFIIVTVIGLANKSIGESTMILWALPLLAILYLSIYATSYFGQRKGRQQLKIIDSFFMMVLDDINRMTPK